MLRHEPGTGISESVRRLVGRGLREVNLGSVAFEACVSQIVVIVPVMSAQQSTWSCMNMHCWPVGKWRSVAPGGELDGL